jgi:hypothetical protein
MPIPNPKKSEKQGDFVFRCMGDETMNKEFPDQKQRAAVCYSQFKKAKASAIATIGFNKDEVLINFEFPKCLDCEELGTEEDLTASNVYFSEEVEYVTAEEVEFNESEVEEYDISAKRPGLWENIRRKKKREGKNYKPAKPGDKDRPTKEAWKKAQGSEYQGRKVTLNKPFRTPGGPKKFAVYVKNESGNVVIVRFGDPNMKIKKNIPERRKSFRARHNCSNPGPKWKARYWACKSW